MHHYQAFATPNYFNHETIQSHHISQLKFLKTDYTEEIINFSVLYLVIVIL